MQNRLCSCFKLRRRLLRSLMAAESRSKILLQWSTSILRAAAPPHLLAACLQSRKKMERAAKWKVWVVWKPKCLNGWMGGKKESATKETFLLIWTFAAPKSLQIRSGPACFAFFCCPPWQQMREHNRFCGGSAAAIIATLPCATARPGFMRGCWNRWAPGASPVIR